MSLGDASNPAAAPRYRPPPDPPPPDATRWPRRIGLACLVVALALTAYFLLRSPPVARIGPKPSPTGNTVVLLHGHGAPATDLQRLAERLLAKLPGTTFLLPAGPHSSGGDGRTWIPSFTAPSRAEYAAQLAVEVKPVIEGVWKVIDSARKRHVDCRQIWVGGFSLGGRMAVEVALRAPPDCRLGGVLVLSGGGAEELDLPERAGGPRLRVLIAHGKSDGVVQIGKAEALARQLVAAGHEVHWLAFAGAHETTPIVDDAARFLQGEDVGVDPASM